jgi:hypothetical protein
MCVFHLHQFSVLISNHGLLFFSRHMLSLVMTRTSSCTCRPLPNWFALCTSCVAGVNFGDVSVYLAGYNIDYYIGLKPQFLHRNWRYENRDINHINGWVLIGAVGSILSEPTRWFYPVDKVTLHFAYYCARIATFSYRWPNQIYSHEPRPRLNSAVLSWHIISHLHEDKASWNFGGSCRWELLCDGCKSDRPNIARSCKFVHIVSHQIR